MLDTLGENTDPEKSDEVDQIFSLPQVCNNLSPNPKVQQRKDKRSFSDYTKYLNNNGLNKSTRLTIG